VFSDDRFRQLYETLCPAEPCRFGRGTDAQIGLGKETMVLETPGQLVKLMLLGAVVVGVREQENYSRGLPSKMAPRERCRPTMMQIGCYFGGVPRAEALGLGRSVTGAWCRTGDREAVLKRS